jgi:hypothetical protein
MPLWPWIERPFRFDYPVTKMPDLLERLRGTPARIEDRVKGVPRDILIRRDGKGWSIQENIGHLIDLGYLPMRRIGEILAGAAVLTAADITNAATHRADHHQRELNELLDEFRRDRAALVDRFERLDPSDWGKAALHPRLKQPLRIVDLACFDSEHDDYHLARIGELLRHWRAAGELDR